MEVSMNLQDCVRDLLAEFRRLEKIEEEARMRKIREFQSERVLRKLKRRYKCELSNVVALPAMTKPQKRIKI